MPFAGDIIKRMRTRAVSPISPWFVDVRTAPCSSGPKRLQLIHTTQKSTRWKIVLPVLILLVLGLLVILLNRERILTILSVADWRFIPWAILFVAISNAMVSLSYVVLARQVGIQMGSRELGDAFFVTNVMNRLVRSGGAAGFSSRYLLMKQYDVSLKDVLNSSFMHFLLGSLIVLAMLPLGVVYILLTLTLPQSTVVLLIVLAFLGPMMGFAAASVLFSEPLRGRMARLAVWLAGRVARRDVHELVDVYTERAAGAVAALRRDRWRLILVMLLLLGEWIANVIVLGFCMKAFGVELPFFATASVYVIATLGGVITALPGGIGVQEGLVTSLAVLQGASFEQAVLGAVLYRILQTFLPYLLSIGFYPRLLKAAPAEICPRVGRIETTAMNSNGSRFLSSREANQ